MSSSENDEDVLVTTEPIPVIFHRIATGNNNALFFIPDYVFLIIGSFVFLFLLCLINRYLSLASVSLAVHTNFLYLKYNSLFSSFLNE